MARSESTTFRTGSEPSLDAILASLRLMAGALEEAKPSAEKLYEVRAAAEAMFPVVLEAIR